MKIGIIVIYFLVVLCIPFVAFADLENSNSEGITKNDMVVEVTSENNVTVTEAIPKNIMIEEQSDSSTPEKRPVENLEQESPDNCMNDEIYWAKVGALGKCNKEAETNTTDWLSILNVVGTLFLGIIAVYQTKKANRQNDQLAKQNERLTRIEEKRDEMEVQPSVLLTGWSGKKILGSSLVIEPDCLYFAIDGAAPEEELTYYYPTLFLSFTNTSKTYIILHYQDAVVRSNIETEKGKELLRWGQSTSNQQAHNITLAPGDTKAIGFYATAATFNKILGKSIEMTLILENRLGKRYKESFEMTLFVFNTVGRGNDIFTSIGPQNYMVELSNVDK